MRFHNDILVPIDKRHCVMLLLLDLSAPFDSVDHDILLTRLHSKYSISDIALEWFRSYLTNRSQFALIEGCRSQSRRMQLPDLLHGLGSIITLLPSSSIFTGYLFLNELDSIFYYVPSKLCNSNLQPTFKTLSPPTYLLDRFSHPLRSVCILLALT